MQSFQFKISPMQSHPINDLIISSFDKVPITLPIKIAAVSLETGSKLGNVKFVFDSLDYTEIW